MTLNEYMARKDGYGRNKYGNRKSEVNGIVFDSRREAKRYEELLLLEKAGAISSLQRQVRYVLIPAQRERTNEIYTKGKKKGCFKPGKLIEKECCYYADFQYTENGKIIVEDVKGMKTEVYKIKRKLMLYIHGIQVKEI